MKVIAIDPGGTTGWAAGVLEPGCFKFVKADSFVLWTGLGELLRSEPHLVLLEDFRIFPGKGRALAGAVLVAPQVIGVVRYLCQEQSITCLMRQASMKVIHPPPRDKAWIGMFLRDRKNEHERDALRHLYSYWLSSICDGALVKLRTQTLIYDEHGMSIP